MNISINKEYSLLTSEEIINIEAPSTIFANITHIDSDTELFIKFIKSGGKILTKTLKFIVRRDSDFENIVALADSITYEELIIYLSNKRFIVTNKNIDTKWLNSLFEIDTLILDSFKTEDGLNYPMFTENIFLKDSVGTYHFKDKVIYISNFEGDITVPHGSMILVDKNPCKMDIYCDGKVSIYFEDPKYARPKDIRIVTGLLSKTNSNELEVYNRRINKFRKIENMNFTNKSEISEFYGCQFINCIFDDHQFVTNSLMVNCYYTTKDRFINCNMNNCKEII